MIHGIISQASTQPVPPARWNDPAILGYALPLLLTFVAGIAGVVVWVKGKVNPIEKRQDRQREDIKDVDTTAKLALLHATPPGVNVDPMTGTPTFATGSRVPGAAVTTRPTHSTESEPPCDAT